MDAASLRDGFIRRAISTCAVVALIFASLAVMPGGVVSSDEALAVGHVAAGNAVDQHYAWAPDGVEWKTGQPKGYTEGETAPFRVVMNSFAEPDAQLYINVCIEVGSGSGPYAFTGFERWDLTYSGVLSEPANAYPPLTGSPGDVFNGAGLTIDYVTYGGLGAGGCTGDYLNATVGFTMDSTPASVGGGVGAVVYGGHVAAPGDPLPAGAGSAYVPSGAGAASINGVFQASLGAGVTGDKTVNFNSADITPIAPEIDIEKSTNGVDADTVTGPFVAVDATVNWSYVVTNIGPNDLVDIVVTDNDAGVTVSCPGGQDTLAAGASMTCTASGTAEAGQYANVGTVVAVDSFGAEATDEDPSHYFGVGGSLVIEKSTNGVDADTVTGPFVAVDGVVDWVYEVTNNSNRTVTGITVTDSDAGVTVECPGTILLAGASMDCTASGTAEAGQYSNVGTVSGTDAAGETVGDTDPSHYFGVGGSLVIEKSTNGVDADTVTGPFVAVDGVVDWVYEVTNNSNRTVTGITVTDSDAGVTVECPGTILLAGASMDCTASGTAEAGQYSNVGTVSGTDAAGETVGDTDPSHYFGAAPAIDIRKGPDNAPSDKGGDLTAVLLGANHTFWITVTNSGNVALTNVNVVDAVTPACDRTSIDIPSLVSLIPGGSVTYSCDVTDITAPILNVAVVTGTAPIVPVTAGSLAATAIVAPTVTDSDPSTVIVVAPSATIGDTVWYDCAKTDVTDPTCDNGVQNSGELGIEGVKVTLTGLDGQDVDPDTVGVQTTLTMVTDANGKYLFSGLLGGNYEVQVLIGDVPDAQSRTLRFTTASSYTILLPDYESRLTVDFGVIADTLPDTGMNADQILFAAILMLGIGLAAVVATRRRGGRID